jgi:hypothetical protein
MTRRVLRGLLVVAVFGVIGFQGGAARAASSYTANADARLFAVDFTTTPPILFDPLFDGGSSVAQAQIDSLGGTAAFAADPYPGSTVLGLPGLLASNGVPTSSAPTYPLVVSSDQANPSGHREAGTIVLDAQSQPNTSSSSATDGAASSQSTATADPDTGEAHAHAEATISSLQLSSTLSLNGVRTSADVTKAPSGTLERTASFEVSSLTVLGQQVALTGTGLTLLGTSVPFGADPNALLSSLLKSLADRGTTIEFIPPTETPDGVTSAGLRITSVQEPPPQVASGLQSFKMQVTVGRASAFVTNTAFPTAAGNMDLTASGPSLPSQPSAMEAAAPSGPASAATPGQVRSSAPADPSAQNSAFIAADISLGRFYPILILAGAVGVAVVSVIRQLGVRRP